LGKRCAMETSERLTAHFGELMTYPQLAELLKRSTVGLRYSLSKRDSAFSRELLTARVKLGRRVYFRTDVIASIVDRA
jgi:hypothetical protein